MGKSEPGDAHSRPSSYISSSADRAETHPRFAIPSRNRINVMGNQCSKSLSRYVLSMSQNPVASHVLTIQCDEA